MCCRLRLRVGMSSLNTRNGSEGRTLGVVRRGRQLARMTNVVIVKDTVECWVLKTMGKTYLTMVAATRTQDCLGSV